MKQLNTRQQVMYHFIREYLQMHGIPPTIWEIGEALGLKTMSLVHYYLRQLQQKGLIELVATRVALTYAALWVIALAAWQAGRLELICSPQLVLAYVWEGIE